MRVVYLTAGAAGMYCGSCMHDNTLARALLAEDVDCMLVPTYTPIRTDERDVSADEVFFGGINIFLEQSFPLWGKLPRVITHWLDSPGLLRRVTRKSGNTSPKLLGALTVSMLQGIEGRQRSEVFRLCDWLAQHAEPDAIILSNFLIGGCLPELKKRFDVPIFVTLQGDDIFLDFLPEPYRGRSIELIKGLEHAVDGFIVNSEFYKQKMQQMLGLSETRFHIVPLGIDVDAFQSTNDTTPLPANRDEQPKIGYLARIDPAKGLHRLVDAFIEMKQLHDRAGAQLHVAGWLGEHNADYAEEQWQRLDDAGLQNRYQYHGSPDHDGKVAFLDSLDVFCVPTDYQEPKGLFLLEAMVMGLPVVVPDHGAPAEIIGASGGGLIVPPGDSVALAEALNSLLTDASSRESLATAGRDFVRNTRRVDQMAKSIISIIKTTNDSGGQ